MGNENSRTGEAIRVALYLFSEGLRKTLGHASQRMVMRITGLARSTICKLILQNQFPVPIKLSKRAVAWLQFEIDGWVSSRVRVH